MTLARHGRVRAGKPPLASDNLVARPSQPYAEEKLYYVGHYQKIFATGMKNHWPQRVYLDLLAGPGKCVIERTGQEFNGSPLRALDAPFTRRLLVEADPSLASALRTRVAGHAEVIEGDVNTSAVIDRLGAACDPSDSLGVAFVDNLGLDVPLATLGRLTAGRRIDLMIVVQVQDLQRNVNDVLDGRDDRTRVDAYFGGPEWESVARDAREQGASGGEIAAALTSYYEGLLRDRLAYPYVDTSLDVMKNRRNVPMYRLMLAGRHQKAVEFFRKIQKVAARGQRRLFA